MPQAEASWVKDEDRWCIAVPDHLANVGAKVVVARADGSHVRPVTVGAVTSREWKGKIVCTIDRGERR